MKKCIFIFLVGFVSYNLVANVADILHENPWDVLRYKFETYPNKVANSWSKLLTKGGAAAGAGSLSYFLGRVVHKYCYDHNESLSTLWIPYNGNAFMKKTAFNLMLPTSLMVSFLTYQVTHNILVRIEQKKQLKHFVENWTEYKPYVPSSLSEKLNKVQQAYLKNKTAFEEQAEEIVDVIISEVNLHFYGDAKRKNFFDAKFFNTVLMVDIARIIEAGVKVFKQL